MSKTKKELENQVLRLLNLPPDVEVVKSEIKADADVITLRIATTHDRVCSNCGASGCIIRGSGRWQELQHFPIDNRRVILRMFKRRLFCPSCGMSSYEAPDWIIPRLRMTRQLFDAIFRLFTQKLAFSQIMQLLLISESSVRSVMDSIEIKHPKRLPETLCIDEFKSDAGYYLRKRQRWCTDDYNVNLTDWKRRVVVDVLQQRNLVFLSKHFKRHYDKYRRMKVRFFVCDMSGSFISLAKECFPNALICIDNFHLVQRLERVVTNVRVQNQNLARYEGRSDDYTLLKNLHLALLTKACNQDRWGPHKEERLERLSLAFDIAPDLKETYDALQHFHDILDSWPFSAQEQELKVWFNEYRFTDIPELKTAVSTFSAYRAYILNAWRYSRSNGPCEGLNKKIKDVKRSMFGAHSFENFRKRILLTCGGLSVDSPQVVLHLERRSKNV